MPQRYTLNAIASTETATRLVDPIDVQGVRSEGGQQDVARALRAHIAFVRELIAKLDDTSVQQSADRVARMLVDA